MTDFSLPQGLWLGRVWRAGIGPSLVILRAGQVIDITYRTTRSLATI